MQLHYQIASGFKPNAHLIGSGTIKTGVELYEDCVPPEEEKDYGGDLVRGSPSMPLEKLLD